MSATAAERPARAWLSHHILKIAERVATPAFYVQRLGMRLLGHRDMTAQQPERFFLGYPSQPRQNDNASSSRGNPPATVLELCYRPEYRRADTPAATGTTDGYWKIGIADDDIDSLRDSLVAAGIGVSPAAQFLDIGYLCHLPDPDGYCIELLQHRFAGKRASLGPAAPRTLGQITLRIRDPRPSLDFYQEILGMRLLSRQVVKPHRFTLYFLACTDERPPDNDIDSVDNREWLWQRPYTCLELLHAWGTENTRFDYRKFHTECYGFQGLGFTVPRLDALPGEQAVDPSQIDTMTKFIEDPDGYSVRLQDIQSSDAT